MSNWIETRITIEDCVPGEMVSAVFKGSESMKRVKKVQTSCWCTDVDWSNKTRCLVARMKVPGADVTKHITVTYEDDTLEVLTFIIKLKNGTSI